MTRARKMIWATALALASFPGCARQPVERIEWTAMGTVAAVQTRGAEAEARSKAVAAAKSAFADVARLLDAHDPDSELSRLAPLPDAELPGRCSPRMRPCYAAALELKRRSGGAFNPRWRGAGTLDFGAIAKGFAVDLAAAAAAGAGDALVDLGGNLKSVRGEWRVGVAGSDAVLVLTNGMACATSAEYFRGKHIRDGRTGLAVSNDVASVTVVHPTSALLADGLSTALFVLGREEGERLLRECCPEAKAIWLEKTSQANGKEH